MVERCPPEVCVQQYACAIDDWREHSPFTGDRCIGGFSDSTVGDRCPGHLDKDSVG